MYVSLVASSFNRPELLDVGLSSIAKYEKFFNLEIVIVNDGIKDDTELVCKKYSDRLNIKYIYSGQRNSSEIISRSPGIPLNIGIKRSVGDIIILSCPEIFHLDDCLNRIVKPLIENKKILVIPNKMYFDNDGQYTNDVKSKKTGDLKLCEVRKDSVQMPFLMGIWKSELLDIGGYDEDFTGYASEDNDLIDRLIMNGNKHYRVDTDIVHLYHGTRNNSGMYWENPKWVYNYQLRISRKNQMIRNLNGWGNG